MEGHSSSGICGFLGIDEKLGWERGRAPTPTEAAPSRTLFNLHGIGHEGKPYKTKEMPTFLMPICGFVGELLEK